MAAHKEKIDSIKKYLSKGEIEIAISELKEVFDTTTILRTEKKKQLGANLVQLSGRIKELNNLKNLGQTNTKEYLQQHSELLLSAIYLLSEYEEELVSKMPDINFVGLIKIEPVEASKLAIKKLEDAQSMKVIGMGRQNFAENSDDNHMLDYYRAIEKKLENETKTNKPFYLKRITQHILKNKFKAHLRECFTIIEKPKNTNRYELVLYGDMKITYTYHIINSYESNKSILFLTLNTQDSDINIFDTSLVFFTEDYDIITKFNKHFDYFWDSEGQKGRVISSLSDFDKYIPFDLVLYSQYNEIKNFIKKVPNDGVRSKHLQSEIDLFYKRLKGLDNCILSYRHTEKNQRITDCFIDYIIDLKDKHKSYKTISVKDFWEMLYDPHLFLDEQEMSLLEGGKIDRVYLVDTSKLNDESKEELLILQRNYEQHIKYPNYCFSILFSIAASEVRRRKNFAIWTDDRPNYKYKVLFSIKYGLNTPAVTDVLFANYLSKKSENMKINRGKVEVFENKFNFFKKRVFEQNKKILAYIKEQKKLPDNERVKDNVLEQQLDFFRRIGIQDIEKFLSEKNMD